MHDYLDYLNFRFTQRKAAWKGDEPFVNTSIKKDLRAIDKLCFSSQFYFVATIYVSGMSQIVLGIQTLLWAEGYNMFGDFCLLPVAVSTYVFCYFTELLCLKVGKLFGIWSIDANIEGAGEDHAAVDREFFHLLDRILDFQKEEERDKDEEVPDHLKFKLKAWNYMDKMKIKDMQLKADLRTDRMVAENFKTLFL